MIIVVSNRNVATVDPLGTDIQFGGADLFGDDFNAQGGPNELRVATAEPVDGRWKVGLLPDIVGDGSMGTERLFAEVLAAIRDGSLPGNWVVFIHGFNQSLVKNLNKCREIESYGVNVLAFSWPSNPGPNGGFLDAASRKREEYRRARANARLSITAVDRFMEKVVRYVRDDAIEGCRISVNLLVHSLGNYLFQRTVEERLFVSELTIFDNIILHQADADNDGHESWVDTLDDAKRVYITINEEDSTLKMSTVVNGRRVGNTPYNLNGELPVYVDFSFGQDVRDQHRLFRPEVDNPVIRKFFARAFNGRRAETVDGFEFDFARNAYQLEYRPGEEENADNTD